MKYAIIKLSGKQYKVEVGQEIVVDKVEAEVSKKIDITEVLMLVDGEDVKVGTPYVDQKVTLEVIEQKKDKKIRVATYKAKSRYRRVLGHRQLKTIFKVVSIGKTAKKATAKKAAPKAKKTTEKKDK